MRVRDVFQRKVDFTTPDSLLSDAARVIFGHKHRGIPVVKKDTKKLLGIITEQDILSQLFPNIRDLVEDYVHEGDFEEMEKNVKGILGKKVRNVMSKKVFSVYLDEPLLKAESLMKINDISRLPVVDKKKRLIGIITKGDIFRALVNPKKKGFKWPTLIRR